MSAGFDELLQGFCEIAEFDPVPLEADERGTKAVTVHLRGIDVALLQFAKARPGAIVLIAHLGPPPEDRAEAAWLSLMHANLQMAGENTPVFSRNARTGEALLQWPLKLEGATAVDLYQRICAMVEVGLQWRDSHFVGEREADAFNWLKPEADSAGSSGEGREHFRRLYRDLCGACGQIAPPWPAGSEELLYFPLSIDEMDVSVAHAPLRHPGCAIVLLDFGTRGGLGPEDAMRCMEANFELISHPMAPVFSRDGSSGSHFLQYAYPLTEECAPKLLGQLGAWARFGRQWRELEAAAESSQPHDQEVA
jgi:hypothetical protein